MHFVGSALVCAAVIACAAPKPASDSTSVAAVDTVKPAVVGSPDSLASQAPATSAGATTKATTTRQTTKPSGTTSKKVGRDSILGRDSVIKTNPHDPRTRLPTKKP
jgi:hypothetical protein